MPDTAGGPWGSFIIYLSCLCSVFPSGISVTLEIKYRPYTAPFFFIPLEASDAVNANYVDGTFHFRSPRNIWQKFLFTLLCGGKKPFMRSVVGRLQLWVREVWWKYQNTDAGSRDRRKGYWADLGTGWWRLVLKLQKKNAGNKFSADNPREKSERKSWKQ